MSFEILGRTSSHMITSFYLSRLPMINGTPATPFPWNHLVHLINSSLALIGLSFEDFPAVKNWYGEARDDLVPFALDCTRVPSPGTLVLF